MQSQKYVPISLSIYAAPYCSLLEELYQLPPELWKDFIGIVEQEICIRAHQFIGSWPSTYSLFIYNRRLAIRNSIQVNASTPKQTNELYYFQKLKKSCLDDNAMKQLKHTNLYLKLLENQKSPSRHGTKFSLASSAGLRCWYYTQSLIFELLR